MSSIGRSLRKLDILYLLSHGQHRKSFDVAATQRLTYIRWSRLVIMLIAGLGGLFNYVEPYKRPFSLLDLTISYPYIHPELVPVQTVLYVCGFAPAIVIALVVLLLVPGPRHCRSLNKAQIVRLKFWEFEKGWAGFCLGLAISFFITQSMKNIFGKPRPNLLARCQPDLTNIAAHQVGGYGEDISARWTLVDASICTTTNKRVLTDGFRSFPSGHSSFSWAAMFYLYVPMSMTSTPTLLTPFTGHSSSAPNSPSPYRFSRTTPLTKWQDFAAMSPTTSSPRRTTPVRQQTIHNRSSRKPITCRRLRSARPRQCAIKPPHHPTTSSSSPCFPWG